MSINKKHRAWLLGFSILFLAPAVWFLTVNRLRDEDGHKPEDVARMFIESVQVGDFVEAATFWKSGDTHNIEANAEMSFESYCAKNFKCDTYQLSMLGTDKRCRVVGFRGKDSSGPKTYALFLERIDGKWQIRMDKFMPD